MKTLKNPWKSKIKRLGEKGNWWKIKLQKKTLDNTKDQSVRKDSGALA